MTDSTTSNNWFKKGDTLKVESFGLKGAEGEEFTIVIERSLESLSQRGQSYEMSANFSASSPSDGVPYFLKVPDQVLSIRRDDLKSHFIREMKRGKELNELIDWVLKSEQTENVTEVEQTNQYPNNSFKLPRHIQAGMIRSVIREGEKAEEEVNLPFIAYEWIRGDSLQELQTSATGDNSLTPMMEKVRQDWFGFAKRLAETVRRLHNHGFLHAYIVPRNIIINEVRDPHFALVGFGYSSLSIESTSTPHRIIRSDIAYRSPEIAAGLELDAVWYAADILDLLHNSFV